MNIVEILCRHALSRPTAAAIRDVHRDQQRSLSFAELDRNASRCAALLARSGIQAGDAVLIFQPMSAELYTALIGVFSIGAIAMFLDPSAGRAHLEQCCSLWPPRALIASPKAHLLRFISPALRRIPKKFVIGSSVPGAIRIQVADDLPARSEIQDCLPDAPALITFTSGSMGRPKAALRTHGFLLAQHRVLEESLSLQPGEMDLTTLPIFVLANLGSGVTSVIPDADLRAPGAIDPAPVIAQIERLKPVSTAASPAFLQRLADYCSTGKRARALDSLKKIFVGGAPVFPRLLADLQRLAPQAVLTAVYGSTEAEPIAEITHSAMQGADFESMRMGRGLLAGAPVKKIHLGILRNHWGTPLGPFTAAGFTAECLPPGEPGEIVVSGEHVLHGYVGGHGDQETKFKVEDTVWHRTGDTGYLDSSGRLWLLGRCDAQIEDERGSLAPFAVECAAMQVSGVRRAAAVRHEGKRLLAIELERDVSASAIASLKEAVAWAHIDTVKVLPRLPVDKRHNAKINYPELHKLLAREGRRPA